MYRWLEQLSTVNQSILLGLVLFLAGYFVLSLGFTIAERMGDGVRPFDVIIVIIFYPLIYTTSLLIVVIANTISLIISPIETFVRVNRNYAKSLRERGKLFRDNSRRGKA